MAVLTGSVTVSLHGLRVMQTTQKEAKKRERERMDLKIDGV